MGLREGLSIANYNFLQSIEDFWGFQPMEKYRRKSIIHVFNSLV